MEDHELLSKVATLYYERNMTEMEIAKQLHFSRSNISRMIKRARDEGVVEIIIHHPYDRMRNLEYEFSNRFHLDEIRIVDTGNHANPSDFYTVTKQGSSCLNSLLSNDSVLGLTWGKSVYGTIQELRPAGFLPKMQVVQMIGSIESHNPLIDGPELVRRVAEVYSCKFYYLLVPFSLDDVIVRDSLIQRPHIIETLSIAEHATVMCTGIGSDTNWGKYMKSEELIEIKKLGAIGYIAGYYFDMNGEIIDLPNFYNRIICAGRKIFTEIPNRIAVIADPVKAQATLGALRGGLINILVTNTKTASRIIELDNNNN